MMWRLLRWHAFIVLKGFSKGGLKETDYTLPDEKVKAKKMNPEEINKFAEAADKIMAEKYRKEKECQSQ